MTVDVVAKYGAMTYHGAMADLAEIAGDCVMVAMITDGIWPLVDVAASNFDSFTVHWDSSGSDGLCSECSDHLFSRRPTSVGLLVLHLKTVYYNTYPGYVRWCLPDEASLGNSTLDFSPSAMNLSYLDLLPALVGK